MSDVSQMTEGTATTPDLPIDAADDLRKRIEALEAEAHRGDAAVELLDELAEANQEVRAARSDWIGKREATKAAKARLDAANEHLSAIVEGWERDLQRPLLNQMPRQEATEPVKELESAADSSWREVRIEELGLTERQAELLHEADVATVGQLEDLRADKGLTSIGGIGQATADKIEEAILAWLSAHRDKTALDAVQAQATGAADVAAPEPLPDAMDAAPEPPPEFTWPAEIEDPTVAGLTTFGIATLDELRDWVSVRPINEIPGVSTEQALVLTRLLANGSHAQTDWRETPLEDTGLPKRARTALERAKLTTMGEVYSWVSAGNRFETLEYVGGPTSAKAQAAIREFCEARGLDDPFAASPGPQDSAAAGPGSEEGAEFDAGLGTGLDSTDADGVDPDFSDDDDDEQDDENYFADDEVDDEEAASEA